MSFQVDWTKESSLWAPEHSTPNHFPLLPMEGRGQEGLEPCLLAVTIGQVEGSITGQTEPLQNPVL